MHQTPVPIPQPPHHGLSGPPMGVRSMHFQHQQPGFATSHPHSYPQSPAAAPHHQPMPNPLSTNYAQGHLPLGARPSLFGPVGSTSSHANVYNPPRPPEVYTIPDSISDFLTPESRRGFQRDESGRILFFTVPPLNRPCAGLSPNSMGLGHSLRYLAGREAWLVERSRKRRERDESRTRQVCNKRVAMWNCGSTLPSGSAASDATAALDNWFQRLGEETVEWRTEVGLDGWWEFDNASSVTW